MPRTLVEILSRNGWCRNTDSPRFARLMARGATSSMALMIGQDHDARNAPPIPRRSFKLLVFSGHGVSDIYFFVLPVVLPMMLAQYHLRYAGGGTVLSIYLLVVALGSVVSGRLSDSLHRWRLIGVGFLLSAVGFASSAGSNPLPLLLVSLAVAATGVSVFHPSMLGAIERTIPSRRSVFYGAFESWSTLVLTAMFFAVGILIRSVSWRYVLVMVAVPGLVMGLIFLTLRWPTDAVVASDGPTASGRRVNDKVATAATRAASPARSLLAIYLAGNMLRFFTITGMLSFVPTYFVHQVGLSPGTAAYAGGVFFAGGVIGARIGGALADRFPPYRILMFSLSALFPLVLLFGTVSAVVPLLVVLFIMGVVAASCVPLQNLLLRDFGSHLGSGQVFGIMMGVMTVTQALSPAAFGFIADAAGLSWAFRLFAIPAFLAWALTWVLVRTPYVKSLAAPIAGATGPVDAPAPASPAP